MGFRTEHCTFSGWAEIQVSTSPWAPVHAGAAPLAEDVLWRVLTATREVRDICGTCLLLAPRTDVHSSRLGNLSRWVSLAFSCPLVPGRAGLSWGGSQVCPWCSGLGPAPRCQDEGKDKRSGGELACDQPPPVVSASSSATLLPPAACALVTGVFLQS